MISNFTEMQINKLSCIQSVEHKIEVGEMVNPALAYIEIQKKLLEYDDFDKMLFPVVILISSMLLSLFASGVHNVLKGRLFLRYVFCWGDYESYYKKITSRNKFFIVVILIGIAVSFVGGILANKFGQ
jgi:hypothetical protein